MTDIKTLIKSGLIGVAVGIVGYFGLNSYVSFNKVSGIRENTLVEKVEGVESEKVEGVESEKVEEGEKRFDYISVMQRLKSKTHFRINKDRRTGVTLAEIEKEHKTNADSAYNNMKEQTRKNYEGLVEKAVEEAKKAWGYDVEDKKPERPVYYHNTHLAKLNQNYKHIAGKNE